ncbi:MAG: response regulator [Anaerolineae bacterium]|nr:response regulator [Anaerolineae bacterium]
MNESRPRVLIVDDEYAIRRFLRTTLDAHAYTVFEAETGEQALNAVLDRRPDIIILDLGLPDMDGIDVIRQLREWSQIPIIVLSVRGYEKDKIAALDSGADDYLTKPFSTGELLARLRVTLRRLAQTKNQPIYDIGQLQVDLAHRRVTIRGEEIGLTPTEYDLLRALVTNAGHVLTHRYLLQQVWGPGYEGETHLLRVNVSNLRRKIEPDPTRPQYILTEPGVGYRLYTDDSSVV